MYLPSLSRDTTFREMSNREHLELVKLIANGMDDQMHIGFDRLICDCCDDHSIMSRMTKVDRFCILLTMYIICVNDTLKFKTQDEQGAVMSLDLSSVLDMVSDYDQKYTQTIQVNQNVSVKLSIPECLHETDLDQIMLNSIRSIKINGNSFDFKQLTSKQKRVAFDQLPGETRDKILQMMIRINDNYQIKVMDVSGENVIISMYNNSMFEFIKMIYNADLESLYYNRYVAAKHMGYSNDYVESITPAELQVQMKFLEREIAEQKKAQEKQSGDGQMMGGMPPPPAG